jgi:hypothetical protein
MVCNYELFLFEQLFFYNLIILVCKKYYLKGNGQLARLDQNHRGPNGVVLAGRTGTTKLSAGRPKQKETTILVNVLGRPTRDALTTIYSVGSIAFCRTHCTEVKLQQISRE